MANSNQTPAVSFPQEKLEKIIENWKKICSNKNVGMLLIARLSENNKTYLSNLGEEYVKEIEASETLKQKKRNDSTERKKGVDWKQVLIKEITTTLQAYENQQLTTFTIDISEVIKLLNTDYEKATIEEIIKANQNLIIMEGNVKTLVLMISYIRGKLYFSLKKKSDNFSDTIDKKLFLPRTQVYRYIRYFMMVAKFPRIIVSNQYFNTIVTHRKIIIEEAEKDPHFRALLCGPLYEFNVQDKQVNLMNQLSQSITGKELIDLDKEMNELDV